MSRPRYAGPMYAPTKEEHDARVAERGRPYTDEPIHVRQVSDDKAPVMKADRLTELVEYRKNKRGAA